MSFIGFCDLPIKYLYYAMQYYTILYYTMLYLQKICGSEENTCKGLYNMIYIYIYILYILYIGLLCFFLKPTFQNCLKHHWDAPLYPISLWSEARIQKKIQCVCFAEMNNRVNFRFSVAYTFVSEAFGWLSELCYSWGPSWVKLATC